MQSSQPQPFRWHIHPKGHHLLVTAGAGRTGEWEGRVEEIKADDVIMKD
jgi:quercetin dioxygenase-like cupin family protein